MKFNKLFMTLAASALAFTACEIDPADLYSTDPVAPVLDEHAAVLMTEPTMQELVTFSWSAARNIGSDVNYTLQAVPADSDALPAVVATTKALSASLTKQAFFALLESNFAVPENENFSINVTVLAEGSGESCLSNTVSVGIYANTEYLPPVIEIPADEDLNIVLEAGTTVELLNWSAAQIGVGEATTYNVYARLFSESGDPSEWQEIASDLTATSYSISAKELNTLLLDWGVAAGYGARIELLVKAYAASAAGGLESAPLSLWVTTYVPVAAVAQWSLIGVNGDWDTDIFMTPVDNGLWISEPVEFSGTFKLRYDSAWDANRGGTLKALGEPFEVVNNGSDIAVPEAGTYCIVYDEVNETVTVHAASEGWGLIGDALAKGWEGDSYKLIETEPGIFRSGAVAIGAGGFKLRLNNDWGVNFGGTFAAYGEPFAAVADGDNIALSDSDVTVYITLDTNTSTITIDNATTRFAGRWGVVGVVNGMNWDGDVFMYETAGLWRSVPFHAEGGFKIRKDAAWSADRGGDFGGFGTPFTVTQGGPNIEVGDDNLGTSCYLIYDPAAETIVVNKVE